jgi:predicted acetyltransferase
MTVRNVRWPDDQDAILEHIRLVYGQNDYYLFAGAYGQTPTFDPADCFVIDGENEGEIAAHAMIVPRQVQIGTSRLPTAEISLLGAVEPGRGYEEALLNALHDHMNVRGYALGLSFGQPVLFEPWGYEYAVGLYLTSYESDISTELAQRAGRWNAGFTSTICRSSRRCTLPKARAVITCLRGMRQPGCGSLTT